MTGSEDFFPHDSLRPIQKEFLDSLYTALVDGKNFLVHAPTGLGKTAASIAPAIKYAIENKKVVFFLTSRHTQHKIAIETISMIKQKKNLDFGVVDFIGRKSMCLVPGVSSLSSGEFFEYCKAVSRKDYTCKYYMKSRTQSGKPTVDAEAVLDEVRNLDLENLMDFCSKKSFCPYELSMMLSEKALVVVCDYYYIFNEDIRRMILGKMGKDLSDLIIIADEAHNLPFRMRDLMTSKTTTNVLSRAVKEAEKYKLQDLADKLNLVSESLETLAFSMNVNDEKLLPKEAFVESISEVGDIRSFISDLEDSADKVREDQKSSFMGSFALFLESWLGEDDGFARIISKREGYTENNIVLSYRCLDSGLVSRDIVNNSHSTILMSGTLVPIEMYRDLLEVRNAVIKIFGSPFPKKNRLNLVVPETTTKFTHRNETQFNRIAAICSSITNNVPGNSAVFFPSYSLRDKINNYFRNISSKSQMVEDPGMTKEDKLEVLEKLESYKDNGIVLLGVSSGSFGEGVDFPGDLLKCVIVVGLPLQSPDLETRETIDYFDKKYGKGWNYGYIFPAFNKVLQNAGRCIRSETDKGIVVFLDERFSWPQYFSCFPDDIELKLTREFEKEVLSFFNGGLQKKLVEEENI
ncbi:MAG: ATP-dependent DNA helicase [Nanoarchaeota archaeon]